MAIVTVCSDFGIQEIKICSISPFPLLFSMKLRESQAGIKIAGRNINNLRYADDTTFRAGSEEELKSLLMKVKN